VYNFTAIRRQVKNSKADQTASDIAPLVRKKSRSANKNNTSTKLTDSTVRIDMSATADGAVAVREIDDGRTKSATNSASMTKTTVNEKSANDGGKKDVGGSANKNASTKLTDISCMWITILHPLTNLGISIR